MTWLSTFLQGTLDCELPPKKKTNISTIMYTSGTTGEPKGVVLTNQAIVAEVLSVDQMFVVTGKVVRDQTLVLSLNRLNVIMIFLFFSYIFLVRIRFYFSFH